MPKSGNFGENLVEFRVDIVGHSSHPTHNKIKHELLLYKYTKYQISESKSER